MSELLPCPFCGKQPVYSVSGHSHWIYCQDDECKLNELSAGSVARWGGSREKVIEAWNRRAQPATPAEQWEPVNVMDNEIETALGTVLITVQDDIITMRFDGRNAPFLKWKLPHSVYLCRRKPGG